MIRRFLLELPRSSLNAGQIIKQLSTSDLVMAKPETSVVANLSEPTTTTGFFIEEPKNRKDYVIIKLNRPPINSLNSKFLTDLTLQIEKLEQNRTINGVILASNIDNVMSAGVDINELYPFDADRCALFWRAIQDFWIKLYGSKKIYIAAINGHAIGAGSLLPMAADYRLMAAGPYKIGANETLLVRFFVCEIFLIRFLNYMIIV